MPFEPNAVMTAKVDLVAYDRQGRMVLAGDVKGVPIEDTAAQLEYLDQWVGPVEFRVLVDPNMLRLYGATGSSAVAIATLTIEQMLAHYLPDSPNRRPFEDLLAGLAIAWLDDLAFHWSEGTPPGIAAAQESGLLARIKDGHAAREVDVRGNALR